MSVVHQEEIAKNNLALVHQTNFMGLFVHAQEKVLVCQTLSPYIPIEAFKSGFEQCANIIEALGVEKFIFDKRSLRAFHQPSMEWYFVAWKQEMFHACNLRRHRKILPPEVWFRKCVEAGRHDIERKHPDNIFNELDIRYTSSIEEALSI